MLKTEGNCTFSRHDSNIMCLSCFCADCQELGEAPPLHFTLAKRTNLQVFHQNQAGSKKNQHQNSTKQLNSWIFSCAKWPALKTLLTGMSQITLSLLCLGFFSSFLLSLVPSLPAGLWPCHGLSSRSWEGSKIVFTKHGKTNEKTEAWWKKCRLMINVLWATQKRLSNCSRPKRNGNYGNEHIPHVCSAGSLLGPESSPTAVSTTAISILQIIES